MSKLRRDWIVRRQILKTPTTRSLAYQRARDIVITKNYVYRLTQLFLGFLSLCNAQSFLLAKLDHSLL